MLFSNVRECREVSRSFCEALEERRKEGVVCRNICDIISDYVSSYMYVFTYVHVQCMSDFCVHTLWLLPHAVQ